MHSAARHLRRLESRHLKRLGNPHRRRKIDRRHNSLHSFKARILKMNRR